jgi:endo-1,4-beta-xylanase
MKQITITVLLIAIVISSSVTLSAESSSPPLPSGQRLREIVAEKFPDGRVLIGGTTGSWAFGRTTGQIMDREFSYVTPENDFKQAIIHPDPHTWNWDRADAWIEHITANGQVLRMHGPVSPQCSRWAKDDERTPEELRQVMEEFVTALYRRYNGKPGFISVDVVNETVVNGKWHTNKKGTPWELPWFLMGQDTDQNKTPLYIKRSFEIANRYAKDLKLIFNHHEDMNAAGSWQLIKDTIAYLRNAGLRVDGIGWQAHVNNGWATTENLAKLRDLIKWAHQNKLEFHVTEASVWIKKEVTPETLPLQAQTYSAIVKVLLEERAHGVVGWNTWHIDDPHGWHSEWKGSLFDGEYAPKPAYYAIQKALETAAENRND